MTIEQLIFKSDFHDMNDKPVDIVGVDALKEFVICIIDNIKAHPEYTTGTIVMMIANIFDIKGVCP